MPNSNPELRAVFVKLKAKFATVLVIVDRPHRSELCRCPSPGTRAAKSPTCPD
ncbi:hypothetical protein ACIQK6_41360 [Streptomyces sp. NPDC091682]|uniref:hypothetical protein n=1 Tax=Streptomyces sp. NPDC091682 TaxID=3366005 RepID=UPI00381FB121